MAGYSKKWHCERCHVPVESMNKPAPGARLCDDCEHLAVVAHTTAGLRTVLHGKLMGFDVSTDRLVLRFGKNRELTIEASRLQKQLRVHSSSSAADIEREP